MRNEEGNITLQGWLAHWSMETRVDYKTTLKYLAYLGYEDGHGKGNGQCFESYESEETKNRSGWEVERCRKGGERWSC